MPHLGEFTKRTHAGLSAEADLHDPKAHASSHESGGSDEIDVSGLTPGAHVSSHEIGGSDALTLTSIDAKACRIKAGTYTGDGSEGQSITGVGFQPKDVVILDYVTVSNTTQYWWRLFEGQVTNGVWASSQQKNYVGATHSLDSDGFTVSDFGNDSDPNKNGRVYKYIAIG